MYLELYEDFQTGFNNNILTQPTHFFHLDILKIFFVLGSNYGYVQMFPSLKSSECAVSILNLLYDNNIVTFLYRHF